MSPSGSVGLGGSDSPITELESTRKVSTTPGTAIQLATGTPCTGAIIQALHTNTALISIGGAAVIAAAGTETGTLLAAGGELTVYNANMADVYMDVRTSGEGVTLNIMK